MSYKDVISNTYRKYIEENSIEFEDWKKAWIIYHARYDNLYNQLKDLDDIASQTEDNDLKFQIESYTDYIRKSIDAFKKSNDNIIYNLIQIEKDYDTYYNCGCYANYNLVRKAANNIVDAPYCIVKMSLIREVDESYRKKFEEYEIYDDYISKITYDKNGNLIDISSDEIDYNESNDMFYDRFAYFPNPFHIGDILKKSIDKDHYGISKDENYLYILSYEQQEDRSKKWSTLDYSDSGIYADCLDTETGSIWNSDTPECPYIFDKADIGPNTEDIAEKIMLSWQGLVRGEHRGFIQYMRDGCQVLRERYDNQEVSYITGLSTRYLFM